MTRAAAMRRSAIALCVWVAYCGGAMADVLKVGVRPDAPPFSARSDALSNVGVASSIGPLGARGYGGFVVRICDAVLLEMQREDASLVVEAVEVSTATRFEVLEAGGIDILCDPATITVDRLARNLNVSPPIYLSGISFVSQSPSVYLDTYCGVIVGLVGDTTSSSRGIGAILAAGEFGRFSKAIRLALGGGQSSMDGLPRCDRARRPVVKIYDSHTALAEDFCGGNVIYYVGDIEIVIRSVGKYQDCDFLSADKTFSDERYGIFSRAYGLADDLHKKNAFLIATFNRLLTRRLFSENSILQTAFREAFPNYRVSDKLRLFFLSIYGINVL